MRWRLKRAQFYYFWIIFYKIQNYFIFEFYGVKIRKLKLSADTKLFLQTSYMGVGGLVTFIS